MCSTSSSSFTPNNQGEWQHAFSFDKQTLSLIVIPAPDKKQVKFTIRVGQ